MRLLQSIAFVLVATAVGFTPASAAGQGNSAIDQYSENLPTVTGQTPSDQVFGPVDTSQATNALSDDVIKELESAGADGRNAAKLANAARTPATGRFESEGPIEATAQGGPGALIPQALGLTGSGGMGLAFPVIVGLSLVGALALLIMRSRSRRGMTG